MEHQQMILNSPDQDHFRSENPGTSAQIAPSQGIPSQRRVQVTVLRAHNVPKISKRFRPRNQYFVAVTDQATTKKTTSVSIKGQTVQWDQPFDAFSVQPSSRLKFCLYAKRLAHSDTLIGMHEMPIPVESQIDIPYTLSNGDGQAGQSDQPVILYLTITVSANATSHPVLPINPANAIATKVDVSPMEPARKSTIAQDSIESVPFVFPTAPESPSPPTDHAPTETIAPIPTVPDVRAAVSPAKNALHDANEATKAIDLPSAWEGVVARIKWVVDTVSPVAELHPYAKMACGLLLAIPKTLLDQFQSDGNVRTLLAAMHDAFDFANQEDILKSIKRGSKQAQILTLMFQHVCNCGDFIQSYTKDPFWKRTLVNLGSQVDNQIEDLRTPLIELRKAFLDQAAITTEITALQILDGVGIISANVGRISTQLDGVATQLKWVSSQVSDAELDAKIREIPYGTGSRFMPEKGCLLGTRTDFLDFVVDWVNSPDSERSLVLFGQAGTGKSSIAHEIARRFDKMHRLTSSFIFLRKEESKREAYRFFTTLAHDLSDRYPSFKAALGRIVKDDSSLRVRTRDYPTLFESLILKPLEDLHIIGPILVVIDALDESGDATGRNGLHTFLAKNLSRLPSNFRVLITSRPEDDILSAFDGAPSIRIKYMNDSELAAQTDNDILTYLRGLLPPDEFEKHGVALTRKAERLFQWAAVAGKFILDPPECFAFSKRECINHLLKPTTDDEGQDPLDELYKEVLEGYITHRKTRLLFRSVVGQLITAFEPLSIGSLISLRGHASNSNNDDADSVVTMLRRLGSLLSNVNSPDGTLPIVPLHTSFRDFLINKEKSGEFSIVLQDAHYGLARSCLGLVLRDLRFNICNIESSHLANRDIRDLEARISEHLPPPLLYACRFYDDHLEHLGFETDLFGKLREFFEKKLLCWFEVLSLTGDMRLALPALSSVNMWLASDRGQVSRTELEKFTAFIHDASAFVRYFGIAMAKSAPHVYLSTLPFAPTCSLVSMHYSNMFSRTLRVKSGRLSHWPSSEMVITHHGGPVNSIALSSDGQRVASGSDDQTICVWNAMTGEMVAGPFSGHSGPVISVAFSPDGQHIASGSSDQKIRVWNAMTGETVAGPFNGHSDYVRSVAFSPDRQHIVSGSSDEKIRVWNATTGETVAGPFNGHSDWVRSVAFSPDGQHIVSGSDDETIRVWNAMTGETVAGPFNGHSNYVMSVAFSPDGQYIASGSYDQTIRVWNAMTGETVAGPFNGHSNYVMSVAFSPDGQYIASGSYDQTIRVWNAMTGERAAGPFSGHSQSVASVAFSPGGQRIVSGSNDRTIRVWNTAMGEMAAGSSSGHSNSVTSVAFSPDGQHIVSGSSDQTIRVWSAMTGETVAGPFNGHSGPVMSVAFSPDGQHIASGSDDKTIRVWNAMTGETVAGPFIGHLNWVMSVAFSPDGQHIASGSSDKTIQVWNAMTGETVAGPFNGHSDWVRSVAFSPDGQHIVSGSDDKTIRVWNAMTGETVAGPLIGHSDYVMSVAFSPDGRHIVSTNDRTIRVWDAMTGEMVAGPFSGHSDPVLSVAFSLDGQRIVSGSSDRTIRVWNAMTGETVAGPFCGHMDSVTSVAFSPDGQHVVSVSNDRAIRLWNVMTGTGETETTEQVAFTNQSKINDEGWICGRNNELLMWIPPLHRNSLRRPSNIWVTHEVRLDLSTFVHGHGWSTCINT